MYHGSVTDKRGRIIEECFGTTREACADILFMLRPNAKSVTTCRAFRDPVEDRIKSTHADIQWTNRYDWEKART